MKRGWHWPVILTAMLVTVIGFNAALIVFATSDPSFAVESDYYDKALHWDDKRAQDALNERLGWSLDVEVEPEATADGRRRVNAALVDADGVPLAGAAVHVEAFHNARASQIFSADLTAEGGGRYGATMALRRPGLWEFRFEVLRDGRRFTRTELRELAPPR